MPLVLVSLLAAVLRLWQPDLAPLRYDDVDVLSRSRDVVDDGPTLTGPLTSWGIPDPPGSVYLMTPPSVVSTPATAAVLWVGSLNVAAVALTYLLALRFHGPWVAFAAGLLFAVNPWSVYFSRRSWAEIVPLFTVLALWAAYEVVGRRQARWAVLFFVALALQVQIRILSLIYGPAALVTLALWPRRWGLRWPAVGVALGALLTVPYLVWLATHWSDVTARLAAGNRGVALAAREGAAELVLWTAAGFGLLPATSEAAPWLNPLGQAGQAALALAGLLLVAGVALALVGAVRRWTGWEGGLLPPLWLVLPVAALLAQSSSIYLHYLVALFPAMFLVMGLPLGWLFGRGRRVLAGAGAVVLVMLVGYQLAITVSLYRIMQAYEVVEPPTSPASLRQAAAGIPREASELLGTGERYGVEPPIRYWHAIAERAAAEARRVGTGEVWVLAGETDPQTAEVPAVLDFLLRPWLEPRFLPADTLLFRMLFPSVVVELPDVDPIESLERFGERRGSVPVPSTNREGLARARITVVPARGPQGWEALAPRRLTAAFEGEVRFMGFRAEGDVSAGDELAVTTMWWVSAQSVSGALVSPRLVDRSGQVVRSEQPDRPLPHVGTGDWVIVRRDLLAVPSRTPPGQYSLDVALLAPDGRPLRLRERPGASLPLTTVRVTER